VSSPPPSNDFPCPFTNAENRLMFHSLLILLHRPFVSEGHLKSAAESTASSAFATCQTAASEIDVLLRLYKSQWCVQSPPYFVSYSTYVSATIHVRTAARSPLGSRAHQNLRNCLEILSEHQSVCHAPRRSMNILLELVSRLNVDVGAVFTASISRTAVYDLRSEDQQAASLHNTTSSFLRRPSNVQNKPSGGIGASTNHELREGDLTQASKTGMESDEPTTTPIEPSMFDQIDAESSPANYGFDEILSNMSFDFDPLFGFNDSQMDFGVEL